VSSFSVGALERVISASSVKAREVSFSSSFRRAAVLVVFWEAAN